MKRVEPDVGANDENGDAIGEEQPVEQDEGRLSRMTRMSELAKEDDTQPVQSQKRFQGS